MTHSALATMTQFTTDRSSRDGTRVDRIQIHHGAATSLSVMLDLQKPGGRTVSSNYVVKDGALVACVPENYRAFTSGSGVDDRRAITFEIANESANGWTVSDETMHTVARAMADIATRYGLSLNDDTVITHQEIYLRFGRSYATACPGDIQRRKGELIALAKTYLVGVTEPAADTSADVLRRKKASMSTYIGWDKLPEVVYEVFRSPVTGRRVMAPLSLQDGAFQRQAGVVTYAGKAYVEQLARDLGYGKPIENVEQLMKRLKVAASA